MKSCAPFQTVAARRVYATAYESTLATCAVPVEASDIATPYGTAHVLTAGDPAAPALVALHGRAASSTMWIAHLPTLVAQHRVVMIDLVGDLNMSVPTKPLARHGDIVAFIDAVLDALAIGNAAFVGMSYGAFASAIYAMHRPRRVARVALLSPAGTFSRVSLRWTLRAMRALMFRPSPRSIDAFVRSMVVPASFPLLAESPNRELFQQWHVGFPGFRPNWRDRAPTQCRTRSFTRLKMPVLVIYGEQETITDGRKAAARARTVLPHARVELLTHANHCVDIDRATRVRELLGDFLDPTPASRS
jgi:pimeloyl-ACP methyl ester carboxylesterase